MVIKLLTIKEMRNHFTNFFRYYTDLFLNTLPHIIGKVPMGTMQLLHILQHQN